MIEIYVNITLRNIKFHVTTVVGVVYHQSHNDGLSL